MQVDANVNHTLDAVRFPESRATRQVEAANSAVSEQGGGSAARAAGSSQASSAQAAEPVRSDPGPDAGRSIDISV